MAHLFCASDERAALCHVPRHAAQPAGGLPRQLQRAAAAAACKSAACALLLLGRCRCMLHAARALHGRPTQRQPMLHVCRADRGGRRLQAVQRQRLRIIWRGKLVQRIRPLPQAPFGGLPAATWIVMFHSHETP